MNGVIEQGICQICSTNKVGIQRTYYHYGIKCDCCSPEHFEIVRHCPTCIPKPPNKTTISLIPTIDRQLTPQSEGDGMIHLTKEEHKQQIIDAVDYCWECNDKKGYVPDGEQYYNQTFSNTK